jgi:hypothetical protein
MHNTGLFPTMVLQMTQIGEESGSLDGMLSKVAEFFEREVDDRGRGAVEPARAYSLSFSGRRHRGLSSSRCTCRYSSLAPSSDGTRKAKRNRAVPPDAAAGGR